LILAFDKIMRMRASNEDPYQTYFKFLGEWK
jgi:hypothetical protein